MASGLVNVILLLLTSRLVPDTSALPELTTQRKDVDSSSTEAMGYTPYVLPPIVDEEKAESDRWSCVKLSSPTFSEYLQQSHPRASRDSHSSTSSNLSVVDARYI
jgi:hypothetical protein